MGLDFPNHPLVAGYSPLDRRSVPRYSFIAEVKVYEPLQGIKLTALVSNISMNGCYIQMATPIFKHALIQLYILKRLESLESWGDVMYLEEARGMGIKFFRPEPSQVKLLQGWIAELKIQQRNH